MLAVLLLRGCLLSKQATRRRRRDSLKPSSNSNEHDRSGSHILGKSHGLAIASSSADWWWLGCCGTEAQEKDGERRGKAEASK